MTEPAITLELVAKHNLTPGGRLGLVTAPKMGILAA